MQSIAIDYEDYTEEELLKMKKSEAVDGLSESQQRFCEAYVEGHNRKTAIIRSGILKGSTNYSSYAARLLKNPNVQRYIVWLKARILRSHIIEAYDVIDEWIRIAFADISDFVDIKPLSIYLKPNDQIDGQLVKSIKSGRDGVSIELYDKMKALDSLAKYMDDMPKEWKQKIEERKADLLEQEFEFKKKIYDIENPEQEDDGFIEAIKKSAKIVWE